MKRLIFAAAFLLSALDVHAQVQTACGAPSQACLASCTRFGKGDARVQACENFCGKHASRTPQSTTTESTTACATSSPTDIPDKLPPARAFPKKGDAVNERDLNAQMSEAIAIGNLKTIRRLIEVRGLNPTYVYAYEFNPETRQYEGRAIRLRLTDIFNDANPLRNDDKGLDNVLALFIELGLDVTATLSTGSGDAASAAAASEARTAWGPSLKFMERAKDRDARIRAFELALQKGLKPNVDVSEWLFAELPQVCGRDRSQFAIQIVELLIKYLGTSIQEGFWRSGERGPETLADVLDRLISPGNARSDFERKQFAQMDSVWENCAPLSHRVNKFLKQGN